MLDTYTMEELMIEYLEDLIETDDTEALPREVQESGRYVLRTGDSAVDDIQRAVAKGEDVDVVKAFDLDDEAVRFLSRKKAEPAKMPEEMPEEFSDNYNKEE